MFEQEQEDVALGVLGEREGFGVGPLVFLKPPLFLERFGNRCVSPFVLAIVATRCGRRDDAFARLGEAIEIRDPSALLIPLEPSFAALHADARWRPLVAKIAPGAAEHATAGAA